MKMNTTLVINSKGGSGKTTLTTNLASYFAANRIPTAIMDFDPQGSSLNWLRLRVDLAPRSTAPMRRRKKPACAASACTCLRGRANS